MNAEVEIVLIAVVTAVAASIPGTYLVLRRTAMVSDAISHAILPGIVIAFFITHDLNSPFLLAAAALTGVLTVFLIEALRRSRLVPEDASIGLVFPALFSVGVILISRYAGDVHLDTDSVLLGELAFAPFDRMIVSGIDLGPRALWTMGVILALNLTAVTLVWKELKLATVDPSLAALLGFSPAAINYALMALVSVTAVGAFDAVGSILVVALMIAPPATAYLLVDRFAPMLWVGRGGGGRQRRARLCGGARSRRFHCRLDGRGVRPAVCSRLRSRAAARTGCAGQTPNHTAAGSLRSHAGGAPPAPPGHRARAR